MTSANRNILIKKSQKRMVTSVTSVDGKSLADVAPNLKNEFANYSDAFTEIGKAIGKRPNFVMTKRVHAAEYAVRG